MNLHGIVSGAISAVNPLVVAQIQISLPATRNSDGSANPQYAPPVAAPAQVQPLDTGDIQHLNELNIQGVNNKIYVNGAVSALIRVRQKGGDLVTLQNGDIYLVKIVFEQWPDWCCVGGVLQNGS